MVYNGKHATVAVRVDGTFVTCDRGGTIDVSADAAKILAGLPGWVKHTTTVNSEEE